jgi:predicted ATPase with chaperone activity
MLQTKTPAPATTWDFIPPFPSDISDLGLKEGFIEELLLKDLSVVGYTLGREMAARVTLPFQIVERALEPLKHQEYIYVRGSSNDGQDFEYAITEKGQERAGICFNNSGYVGPCPVPWDSYIKAVRAQSIRRESVRPRDLEIAFSDIMITRHTLNSLGPAINSGSGMFLFGDAGNGKTSIADRIARSFKGNIFIPYAIHLDGQIIRVFDNENHIRVPESELPREYDHRWVAIRRPSITVGGELTIEMLDLQYDYATRVYEAPVQLKSNCGLLHVDDFGRQRIDHTALLNRWIVPLDRHVDYLAMHTGKKLEVPFDQLIVFSTNIEPSTIVDEAFLRRIPYKINISSPSEDEYKWIFNQYCQRAGIQYNEEAVNYLLDTQYRTNLHPMRCCQPRDLIDQVINLCHFLQVEPRLSREYLDHAASVYFAATGV